MTAKKHDRPPGFLLKPPVNAFRFDFHFRQEIVISLYVRAAGSADLNEGEFSPIRGILLQHSLHRQETLNNSLGVVHTVYANANKSSVYPYLLEQAHAVCISRLVRGG